MEVLATVTKDRSPWRVGVSLLPLSALHDRLDRSTRSGEGHDLVALIGARRTRLVPNEVRAILRSRPEALVGARPLDPSGTAYVTTGAIDPFAAGAIQDRFQVVAGRNARFDSGGLYWHERFSYDSRGNRTSVENGLGSVAFTYDPADRVRSAGNKTFEHDLDGNLIDERLGDWEVVHEYNGRNRIAHSSGNLLGWTFDSDPATEIS